MIENLTRKQLRYLMFRFKSEATESNPIRGQEALDLLTGWGIKTTKTKANGLLGDIRDHYEAEPAFGGWENFCGPEGKAKSWDIGMYNPSIGDMNIALMISRPHKWALFGIPMERAVDIRLYRQSVPNGLDYFKSVKKSLIFTARQMAEKRMRNPGSHDPRMRDPMHYENDEREFNYESIIKHAIENEVSQWH